MNAAAHAVHASARAPETDLFGEPVQPPRNTAAMEVRGRLSADAVVRQQASDHGHARAVLCVDLDNVGPGLHHVHVEQPFDHAHRFLADAAALRLKRGTWVCVAAPLADCRWTLPNAASITPDPSPPKDH